MRKIPKKPKVGALVTIHPATGMRSGKARVIRKPPLSLLQKHYGLAAEIIHMRTPTRPLWAFKLFWVVFLEGEQNPCQIWTWRLAAPLEGGLQENK